MAACSAIAFRPARLLLSLLVLAVVASAATAIKWSKNGRGYYASNCDFYGNDLVLVRTDHCARVCELVLGCTHWTWNIGKGRKCYLKKGRRSLSDARHLPGRAQCGAKA